MVPSFCQFSLLCFLWLVVFALSVIVLLLGDLFLEVLWVMWLLSSDFIFGLIEVAILIAHV